MKEFNVLYTTDHNYLKYMITSMYSLLDSNSDNMFLKIHIINDKFEKEDYDLIEKVSSMFPNNCVIFHPFNKIKEKIEKYDIPDWRETKIANARVFFTEEINNVPNLLYLDSDTFVVDNLNEIKKYNGAINMVKDVMPKYIMDDLGVPVKFYCNSGVIYINMDNWMKNDCDKKIADTLQSKKVNFRYPDQDIINASLKDDIEVMSPEFNLLSTDAYYSMPFLKLYDKNTNIIDRYSNQEMRLAKKYPIILHGTPLSFFRDYKLENRLHPYNGLYTRINERIYGDRKEEKLDLLEKVTMDLGLHAKVMFPKKIRTKVRKLVRND